MRRAIAIDFDGCICQSKYPEIGEPNWHVIEEAKKEQEAGAGLILWTCRAGKELDAAIAACKEWGLNFDTVNQSLPEWVSVSGGGDPLFHWKDHWSFYEGLFHTAERRNVKLEMHTSYLPDSPEVQDFPLNWFERVVYHVHKFDDLLHVKRKFGEIVRVVFVVDDNMTEQDVLFIAGYVAGSKEIDELSFRQRVDENYKETYHLHDLLTEYHKKLWWYITQCDYNLYFHNGKVYMKYTDIFTEGSNGLG